MPDATESDYANRAIRDYFCQGNCRGTLCTHLDGGDTGDAVPEVPSKSIIYGTFGIPSG